jgi:hypothetical protein
LCSWYLPHWAWNICTHVVVSRINEAPRQVRHYLVTDVRSECRR